MATIKIGVIGIGIGRARELVAASMMRDKIELVPIMIAEPTPKLTDIKLKAMVLDKGIQGIICGDINDHLNAQAIELAEDNHLQIAQLTAHDSLADSEMADKVEKRERRREAINDFGDTNWTGGRRRRQRGVNRGK